MKVKVRKIGIPEDNPFIHDKLGREPQVENLITLLLNSDSPIVFSINAPWGTGKTVFQKMLAAQLKLKEEYVVYFNAWETDFAPDPLLTFLVEIESTLLKLAGENTSKRQIVRTAIKVGKQILNRTIPVGVNLATVGLVDIGGLEGGAANLAETVSQELIKEYTQAKDRIAEFKENVGQLLKQDDETVSTIYILIDEIDRCRPTYALELLERIKHLFEIEGLVFVVSMNRLQLAHSVQAVYGGSFDGAGYLRRFIDVEYSLPETGREQYIGYLLDVLGYEKFLTSRVKPSNVHFLRQALKDSLSLFFNSRALSLRDIEQLMSRTNLVFRSTPVNEVLSPSLALLIVFLIVARELCSAVYAECIRQDGTWALMVKVLHDIVPESARYGSHECRLIEAILLASALFDNQLDDSERRNVEARIQGYREVKDDIDATKPVKHHAERVIGLVEEHSRQREFLRRSSMRTLIERIELVAEHIGISTQDEEGNPHIGHH